MSEKRAKHHQGQNASTNFDGSAHAMQSRHFTVNSLTVCRDLGRKKQPGRGVREFPPLFFPALTSRRTPLSECLEQPKIFGLTSVETTKARV